MLIGEQLIDYSHLDDEFEIQEKKQKKKKILLRTGLAIPLAAIAAFVMLKGYQITDRWMDNLGSYYGTKAQITQIQSDNKRQDAVDANLKQRLSGLDGKLAKLTEYVEPIEPFDVHNFSIYGTKPQNYLFTNKGLIGITNKGHNLSHKQVIEGIVEASEKYNSITDKETLLKIMGIYGNNPSLTGKSYKLTQLIDDILNNY